MTSYGSITITDLTDQSTYIRYSANADGSGFNTTPNKYIGIYTGTKEESSLVASDFKWSQIQGNTGDSVTVTSTTTSYQVGASNTTKPTGTWVTTNPPSTDATNKYLWTKVVVTFNSGSPAEFYSVSSTMDSIEIGGRNLLKGTHSTPVDYTYPASSFSDKKQWETTQKLNGTTYTLSFWAKSTVANDKIRVHFYNPSNITKVVGSQGQNGTASDGSCDFILTTTWTKYWVTYTIPVNGDSTRKVIIARMYSDFGTGTVSIKWEKLEEGNTSTDWTPAPEDVDDNISEAAKTATNFLEVTNNNGIKIGNKTSGSYVGYYTIIDNDSLDIYNGSNEVVATYGERVQIGKDNDTRVEIDNGSFTAYSGNTKYFEVSADGGYINANSGKFGSEARYFTIDSDALVGYETYKIVQVYNDSTLFDNLLTVIDKSRSDVSSIATYNIIINNFNANQSGYKIETSYNKTTGVGTITVAFPATLSDTEISNMISGSTRDTVEIDATVLLTDGSTESADVTLTEINIVSSHFLVVNPSYEHETGTEIGYDYIKTHDLQADGGKFGNFNGTNYGDGYFNIDENALIGVGIRFDYMKLCSIGIFSNTSFYKLDTFNFSNITLYNSDETKSKNLISECLIKGTKVEWSDTNLILYIKPTDDWKNKTLYDILGFTPSKIYTEYSFKNFQDLDSSGNSTRTANFPLVNDLPPLIGTVTGTEIGYDYVETNNLIANGGYIGSWQIKDDYLSGNVKSGDITTGTAKLKPEEFVITHDDNLDRYEAIVEPGVVSCRKYTLEQQSGGSYDYVMKNNTEINHNSIYCPGAIDSSGWITGIHVRSKYQTGEATVMAMGKAGNVYLCSTNDNTINGILGVYGVHTYYGDSWIVYKDGNNVPHLWSPSDRRLKNHIEELSDKEAYALLKNLKTNVFAYKPDEKQEKPYVGFYAQDIKDILVNNDIGYRSYLQIENKEDKTIVSDIYASEEDVTYSVEYDKMLPIVWKGWQMHEERINTLEKENAELKERIERLEKLILNKEV